MEQRPFYNFLYDKLSTAEYRMNTGWALVISTDVAIDNIEDDTHIDISVFIDFYLTFKKKKKNLRTK